MWNRDVFGSINQIKENIIRRISDLDKMDGDSFKVEGLIQN